LRSYLHAAEESKRFQAGLSAAVVEFDEEVRSKAVSEALEDIVRKLEAVNGVVPGPLEMKQAE